MTEMDERIDSARSAAAYRIMKYWLPVVIVLGAMYYFSTDVFSADNTHTIIEKIFLWFKPHASVRAMAAFQYLVRKSAHFAEYAILGAMLFRAFRADDPARWRLRWTFYSLATAVSWALLDELHQSFTRTRGGSLLDSLLDSSGALFALAWIAIATRRPGIEDTQQRERITRDLRSEV